MKKPSSSRAAWGLALLLAVVLVGSVIAGVAAYGNQTRAFAVHWEADWHYWWVGQRPLVLAACGPHGWSRGTLQGERYSMGFVEVEVPHHGPEVVLWDTFPKASTHNATSRSR